MLDSGERKVVEVLIERDGMSYMRAKAYFEENMQEVYDAIESGDTLLAEELFTDNFGLEIDYLEEILAFGCLW